jgi:hypothetical protein
MKKQRLFITHQEVVELHVELRDVDRKSKHIGSDFIDGSHGGGCSGGWTNTEVFVDLFRESSGKA